MIAVAKAGYRAIAPDFRDYGLSEIPQEPEKASFSDLIKDLLIIVDSLSISKAFIVAKDFGARPGYLFAILHPERVRGVVAIGVPFLPPGPSLAFAIRNIYILFSKSEIPIAPEDKEIMDLVDESHPLPPWFSEEDLSAYASLYEKSGFHTALQVPYRSINEQFGINNPKLDVPVLVIMGEKDYVLKFPGMEQYISSEKVKEYVPDMELTSLPEGTHFAQEQFPEQVNELIIKFLSKHNHV
ncbi:hypothetical protein C5167_019371 [Papaver somniferum]|uniref:AB hydrolase-1 domain-containing protein n=1 Tax=Papaver somniferum TaxID=3469 RepID=A0A4Y7IT15_PAPSO|nr:bifunctional epoxide hydrolase 2-like [Papaver somniferum]RZC50940.1 hypothetical protein C5167_019371 [Papaver somniferum]